MKIKAELEGLLSWLNENYPPSPRHVALREAIERWEALEELHGLVEVYGSDELVEKARRLWDEQ